MERLTFWGHLTRIMRAGLRQAAGDRIINQAVRRDRDLLVIMPRGGEPLVLNLAEHRKVHLLAAGKASRSLVKAMGPAIQDHLAGGLMVVPQSDSDPDCMLPVLTASHPTPDATSLFAGRAWLGYLRQVDPRDLVLVLVSGGASSLLSVPVPGVSMQEKASLLNNLMASGVPIRELNVVRKHLSQVKGGHTALAAAHATVVGLVVSDVVGNHLDTVGSGLTTPDPSTYTDVRTILERYGLWQRAASSIRQHITSGIEGRVDETPKPEDGLLANSRTLLLADNRLVVDGCAAEAAALGYQTRVVSYSMEGEAREVGAAMGRKAAEIRVAGLNRGKPVCLIWGGETTVSVRGNGRGGRNQEMALAASIELAACPGSAFMSFASDGIDGPTSAAGAIAYTDTLPRALSRSMNPVDYMRRNDSFAFFEPLGDLVMLGNTGSNLMDVQVLLVDGSDTE